LPWLEELDRDCSVADELVDEISGAPDDTEIDRLGTKDEDDKVSELLWAPVADAVDASEDVEKLKLALVPDSEVLDDCEAVLEVSA
jgi:hypothetical protein